MGLINQLNTCTHLNENVTEVMTMTRQIKYIKNWDKHVKAFPFVPAQRCRLAAEIDNTKKFTAKKRATLKKKSSKQ